MTRPARAAVLCASCLAAFAAFLMLTNNPDPNVVARAALVRTACEFAAGCLLYRLHAAGTRPGALAAPAAAVLIAAGLLFPGWAVLAVFGFPFLIFLAAEPSGLAARVLSTRVMVFLGEISFSIYLLHWILLLVSNRLRATLNLGTAGELAWFACYAATVIVLSAATYRLIESPARQMLRSAEENRAVSLAT